MNMPSNQYNLEHLTPLSEERQRLMDAVEESQWEGDMHRADLLSTELYLVNQCITKGELYAPLF
jgi:hypothetical protein|tara:strand:+ start:331 stop:522 length:192 start_codon:yes stop_codon:yes gene_type:complete